MTDKNDAGDSQPFGAWFPLLFKRVVKASCREQLEGLGIDALVRHDFGPRGTVAPDEAMLTAKAHLGFSLMAPSAHRVVSDAATTEEPSMAELRELTRLVGSK